MHDADSSTMATGPGLLATALALRSALASSASETELLRHLIQASDDFDALADDDARRLFLAEPSLTGDPRYDALLAGLAVHLCRRAGLPTTPAWTRDECRYLDRMWWFGLDGDSGLQAYVFQRTPSCMRSRGVLFNADNLASV
jgi:hypothetical protein